MILIFGSNPEISEGIADLIPEKLKTMRIQLQPGIEMCSDELCNQLKTATFAIVNLDGIHEEGIGLISKIKTKLPKIRILAIDTHDSQAMASHLISHGANAYLPITAGLEMLQKTILEQISDRNP